MVNINIIKKTKRKWLYYRILYYLPKTESKYQCVICCFVMFFFSENFVTSLILANQLDTDNKIINSEQRIM